METPVEPAAVTFESFNLRPEVLNALKNLGYEEPTPIQRECIPALIGGRDVLGQAATGTGKTAAFALPILERVSQKDRRPFEAQALVLVPTRELAMQVTEAVQKYGAGIGVTALAVYGGQEIFTQIKPLKRGVDVVVATPGRALDHIKRKSLLLGKVKVVVLDEADEMLDMGFEEDLQSILNELPAERQTALFSATLAPRIAKIAERHLKNPVRVTIAARAAEAGTLPNITQTAYVVQRKLKEAALMRVLEWETPQSAIIFCRTRNEVEDLTHSLMRSGYEPAALHGGLTQEQRDQVLKRFKDGAVRVLVATDVAARGLHVENLSHVVNFDLPTSPEVYVHRIGRTGRAGKQGVALSFLDPREKRLLQNVERLLKKKIPLAKVPGREDLDARRAASVGQTVKAALEDARVAGFVELANEAAEGSSLETVAAAAMMLLQQKMFPAHESDSVDIAAPSERPERGNFRERGERPERASGGRSFRERDEERPRGERGGSRSGQVALSLSLGKRAGVRPQDLVGAIANEANVPSKEINGIRIDEYTSRVEVPESAAERVIAALHATKIRGRKVRVDREETGRTARAARFTREAESDDAFIPNAEEEEAPRSRYSAAPDEEAPAPKVSAPRAPRASAPKRVKSEEAAPREEGRFRPEGGGRFGNRPQGGARFGKSEGGRFGNKPEGGARFGKSEGGRFGNKPEGGARFGKSEGSRFGNKPEGGARFGKPEGGRFGNKPEGGARFGKSEGGRFGNKPEGGARFGKPRAERSDKPADGPRFATPRGSKRHGRMSSNRK